MGDTIQKLTVMLWIGNCIHEGDVISYFGSVPIAENFTLCMTGTDSHHILRSIVANLVTVADYLYKRKFKAVHKTRIDLHCELKSTMTFQVHFVLPFSMAKSNCRSQTLYCLQLV